MAKLPPSEPEVLFDSSSGKNELKERDSSSGKFTKGHSKRGGRGKGTPNRVNADAKALMDELVEHGLKKAKQLFDKSAKKSPTRALQTLARFAEYRLPKLQRTEVTGPQGGPQVIEKRVYVSAASPSEQDEIAARLHAAKGERDGE